MLEHGRHWQPAPGACQAHIYIRTVLERLDNLERHMTSVENAFSDLDVEITALIDLAQTAAQHADDDTAAQIEQRVATIRTALAAAQQAAPAPPQPVDDTPAAPVDTTPATTDDGTGNTDTSEATVTTG